MSNKPLPSTIAPTCVLPLAELRPGAEARLHEVRVDPECRSLLRALGLTDACRLRLCKLGEPCIIQVRSTRIGLSQGIAENLFVVAEDAGTV